MDAEVVIVGGSFAGSCLALALARRGVKVLVIERLAEAPRVCKADVMHARTAEILTQLGAEEALQRATLPLTHLRLGFEGRTPATIDLRQMTGLDCPLRGVDHLLLIPIVERLALAAGCEYLRATVREVLWEGDIVTGVRLEGGETVRARLTVGADGPNSLVRQSLGVPERRWSSLSAGTALVIDGVSHLSPETALIFGNAGRGGYGVPLPGNRLRVYLGGAERETNPDAVREALCRLFPWWADSIAAHTGRPWGVPTADRLQVGAWVRDGAALLGDAGNVVNPHAGQGMNFAIQGANLLATVYRDLPRRGPVTVADLAPYETAMLRRAAVVHGLSRTVGSGRLMQHPVLRALLSLGLRGFAAAPWIARSTALTAAGYRHGL